MASPAALHTVVFSCVKRTYLISWDTEADWTRHGGWSVKIHLNRFSIWMDGEKACCSPGSVEENMSQVLDFIRVADEWVAAVQAAQSTRKQETLLTHT